LLPCSGCSLHSFGHNSQQPNLEAYRFFMGAKANILQTSASAVCYSVAECCWLVWSRSSHINLTDCQLNSTRWLISGCLHPTQTQWLPVLANIPPANLHWKSSVDKKMLCKIDNRQDWPVHADVFSLTHLSDFHHGIPSGWICLLWTWTHSIKRTGHQLQ